MPFIDSNRVYADGHAVSTNNLEFYIERPAPHAFLAY